MVYTLVKGFMVYYDQVSPADFMWVVEFFIRGGADLLCSSPSRFTAYIRFV